VRRGNRPGLKSRKLAEEQPDTSIDVAIHLGLSGRRRHQVTTGLAFIQCHSPDINLLALQWTGKANRVGGDPAHQVHSAARPADSRFGGSSFLGH
jgi:hypothetical protein